MKEMSIQTVLGRIPARALGHCQVHEHIFVRDTPAARRSPDLRFDDLEKSAQELQAYKAAGGVSIGDAQPVGAGRDAAVLTALSERTGVNIVASTGYHLRAFHSGPYEAEEGALYELYCSELREGMLDTQGQRLSARAGMVKAAIPAGGPEGVYRTRLRAAARAAADCGAPLMLHTEAGQNAEKAVALCGEAGLAPERILLCHADRDAGDTEKHLRLARLGVYLEYDTIARPKYHGEEAEIRLILRMLEAGYEDRLLLSLDTTRSRLGAYGGKISLSYLRESALPQLERAGAAPPLLEKITVANPARALSLREG